MHQSNDKMILHFKTLAELDVWWEEEQCRSNLQEIPPPNYPLFLHAADDSRVDENRQQPRLIICHDMMGGYVEDAQEHEHSHSDGSANGLFHLSKWSCIDTFIYFAHHRISLPPTLMDKDMAIMRMGLRYWLRLSRNGIRGIPENEKLVSNPQFHVAALTHLAVKFGFDGWFINIESPGKPAIAGAFCSFLAQLTESIHSHIGAHGQVIWYDSLTEAGAIRWQNRLSPLNQCFFFNCDGIFTNYTWQESDPKESALLARSRKYDVFHGIDVHGRNTWGGGGWDCWKAVKKSIESETSVALFAWAWIYEAFMEQDKKQQPQNQMNLFRQRERRYFEGSKYYQDETSINRYFPARALRVAPGSDFSTSFSLPFGDHFCINGKVVSDKGWKLLWHQSILPSYDNWAFESEKTDCNSISNPPFSVSVTTKYAYIKGSSLLVRSKRDLSTMSYYHFPLFHLEYPCPDNLFLVFTMLSLIPADKIEDNFWLYLVVAAATGDGESKKVVLLDIPTSKTQEWEQQILDLSSHVKPGEVISCIGIKCRMSSNVSQSSSVGWEHLFAFGSLHLTESTEIDEMPLYTIHSLQLEADGLLTWDLEYPLSTYQFFNIYDESLGWLGSSHGRTFQVPGSKVKEITKLTVQPVLRKLYTTLERGECPSLLP